MEERFAFHFPVTSSVKLSDMGWRLASRAICPKISPK
ncbi:hypothetical protein TNCV_4090921, partial [Trichonephila clavipes]